NPWGWHPLLLESHQEEWFKFIAPKTEDQITKIKVMIRVMDAIPKDYPIEYHIDHRIQL
ncbi:unnamed protein product, partial [marine sediment metagenome]